ncbi:hypothetical protein HPO96_04230 [Kribbella sandramycini]|uniref:Uncharacterized protein n=1 Tax=Kribbella sandramycini TaxID=60450 RepID=A0A7Y4KVL7_9ACTN|nr:hypothetical protein [Kribbella sandramycini]MBB6567957.1 hypothetical protein [Kribbella sandramycini]NOL39448.1 hypothetical protein [Kribbella sandramycini]
MEFRPDGTLLTYAIGPADTPTPSPAGHWTHTGTLTNGHIVTATPDRLEIRWET